MKKILSLIILPLIVLIGCPMEQPKPEPQIPEDTDFCKSGCEYLMTLPGRDGKPGCEEARPLVLEDGATVSCEQFCTETQKNGRSLCPSRWKEVKECDDIEKFRLDCPINQ